MDINNELYMFECIEVNENFGVQRVPCRMDEASKYSFGIR